MRIHYVAGPVTLGLLFAWTLASRAADEAISPNPPSPIMTPSPIPQPLPPAPEPTPSASPVADITRNRLFSKLHDFDQRSVYAAKIAWVHSARAELWQLSKKINQELTAVDTELLSLAHSRGLTVTHVIPRTADEYFEIDRERETMDNLKWLRGDLFDQEYLRYVVTEQSIAADMLTRAAQTLPPPSSDFRDALKAWTIKIQGECDAAVAIQQSLAPSPPPSIGL